MKTLEYRRLTMPVNLAATRADLSPERRNAAEAMLLNMRLKSLLIDAITDRNQHAYRRTLRVFRRAATRLKRRYNAVTPTPVLQLGNIHKTPASMPRPQQQQPLFTGKTLAAAA